MPQRKCSVKAHKQNEKRRIHNTGIKNDLKKTVKNFVATVPTDVKQAQTLLADVYKKIDKAAKRNIMHKKTANRRKAKFAKLLAAK